MTIGIIEIADRFILPLVNKAIQEIIETFGVPEDEAKDIVANSWLQLMEEIGIAAVAIRSKTPTKVAKLLGFNTKGFRKRPIKSSTKNKLGKQGSTGAIKAGQVVKLPRKEAQQVVNDAKKAIPGFKAAVDTTFKGLGLLFLGALTIAQWIDFGNWNSGAYQKKMQKVLATITFGALVPDEDYRKTKTTSPDVFNKVLNAYKLEGATFIADPFKQATVPFTRDNLLDVVDQIGASLLLTEGSASTRDVLQATQGMIRFDNLETEPTPATIAPTTKPVFLPKREKIALAKTDDKLTNLALAKVADFLDNFGDRLDFELTTKKNPINKNGQFLVGKYYTLQIRFRSGQFRSTKLAEFILRPFGEDEKALTSAEEQPFESALREAVRGRTQKTTETTTQPTNETTVDSQLTQLPKPAVKGPLSDTLFKYAKRDKDDQIIELDPLRFPEEMIDPATSQADGRARFTSQTRDKMLAVLKEKRNLNAQIAGTILDILDTAEGTRSSHIRSELSKPPFNGIEAVKEAFGGPKAMAIHIINGGKTQTIEIPLRSLPSGGQTGGVSTLAPMEGPTGAEKKPYVIFEGSPDVFDRETGKFQTFKDAKEKGIFKNDLVERLPDPRPEISSDEDFAAFAGKDLTQFPV
ncbi:MAG: hypothetical protein ACE5HI_07360 [bacterium]